MKILATALILILLAPFNGVASSAMQLGIAASPMADHAMTMDEAGSHDHSAMAGDGHLQTMMESHDHGEEDCDEYCMSCSNHCSSTAIISGSAQTFDPSARFARCTVAHVANRADLLFRPPIRA